MSDLKALMLREPRLTLAVAESLTGGRLQAMIVGASWRSAMTATVGWVFAQARWNMSIMRW